MRFATLVLPIVLVGCRDDAKSTISREAQTMSTPSASATTSTSSPDATGSASVSTAVAPPPSPPPTWPNAHRVTSADASFSLLHPPLFKKTSAKGDAIVLQSDVSEPSWGKSDGADIVFGIELTKLRVSVASVLSKYVSLADGTERTFVASPGFADRENGASGARGYVVTIGVEGTGDVVHVFTTKDGSSWRFDCNYCCGLVGKPKMTSDAQLALCTDVMHAFQAEHDRAP